jgi:hypothetical protein
MSRMAPLSGMYGPPAARCSTVSVLASLIDPTV